MADSELAGCEFSGEILIVYLRKMAQDILNDLTEQKIKYFIKTFGDFGDRIPSDELLEALAEADYMNEHPEKYKSYDSAEEMVRNILGSDDTSL